MSGDVQAPTALAERITEQLAVPVDDDVRSFAAALGEAAGARAVLFYGSNLRTGSLDGVLDFYVLTPGPQVERIWPRVSYHERDTDGGITLRAKVATMSLRGFAKAAAGELTDTTIWARFVQPSALVWAGNVAAQSSDTKHDVTTAIADAAKTAAQLAVALGPKSGTADEYWRALFRATYQAEFRVEKMGRENDILSVNAAHFAGLLPLALRAKGIEFGQQGGVLTPKLGDAERARIIAWWSRRRRLGKPLNFVRLLKASTTFEGATRYAAWKIERHTGMPVEVTSFRERHPILAAPGVLFSLWRHRRNAARRDG